MGSKRTKSDKRENEMKGRAKAMKVMKEWETMRVYGEIVNRWTSWNDEKGREVTIQVEVAYKEYDRLGNLVAEGTEDFSPARWNEQTSGYAVWGWNGQHRNRGGHKYFDRLDDFIRINRKDVWKLREICKSWFSWLYENGVAEFSIRKF